MNSIKRIIPSSLASWCGILFAGATEAQVLPLDQWKSGINRTEIQYNNDNISGACTNAINLAHSMISKAFEVRQAGNKTLVQGIIFLMWDWPTYVGQYCSGRRLVKKSRLWDAIDRR